MCWLAPLPDASVLVLGAPRHSSQGYREVIEGEGVPSIISGKQVMALFALHFKLSVEGGGKGEVG